MYPSRSTLSAFCTLFLVSIVALCSSCSQPGNDTDRERSGLPTAEPVRLTPNGIDVGEPDVAADDAGNRYIVYAEHVDGRNSDIKLLKLNSEGKPVGEPIRLNAGSGEAKIWAGDPPRIVVRGQNVYIGWTRKYADPAAKGNDLVLSVSRDAGNTFDPPVRVNDDTVPASHGMHSLAVADNGALMMLWLDERSLAGKAMPMTDHHEMTEPNAEVYYAVSTDDGRSFGGNKRIASDVCPCCKTSLLVGPSGTVFASWRQVLEGDHRHIAVARSDDNGSTFGPQVIVSDDKWQINACPVSGAALLSSGPGTIDVIWYTAGEAGQSGLYFARSTDNANSFSSRVMLSNEGAAGTPTAVLDGEKATVIFPIVDGGLGVVSWNSSPVSETKRSRIENASLPAAVTSGRTSIVFVRTENGKRSIWMQ